MDTKVSALITEGIKEMSFSEILSFCFLPGVRKDDF